jgi:hypothetical protein
MLVDLSGIISAGAVLPLQVAVAGFWAWWLVARSPAKAWEARPAFALTPALGGAQVNITLIIRPK